MKPRLIILGLLFAVMSWASLSYSDVPQMINYQGKITKPSGALIDTTVEMIFTIYDAATDGGIFWADTQSAVVVEKGVFNTLLGSINPIPDSVFDGNVRYLGIKVGADPEMTPRKEMVSVAYAYTDGDWIISGNNVYREKGNVGIGTNNPLTGLHVDNDTDGFVGISIENTNTESSSSEGIYFWNEDMGVAGIRLFDDDAPSYPGRMNIFNNRPGGSVHFGTGGQLTRMTIANDGNVGIGNPSPQYKLDISGTTGIDVGSNFGDVPLTINVPSNQSALISRIAKGGSVINVVDGDGNVGIGTFNPTGKLDVNGNDIRIRTSQTPASSSADGYTGEIAWDSNYIYICVSGDGPGGGTDSWKRAALSTW